MKANDLAAALRRDLFDVLTRYKLLSQQLQQLDNSDAQYAGEELAAAAIDLNKAYNAIRECDISIDAARDADCQLYGFDISQK